MKAHFFFNLRAPRLVPGTPASNLFGAAESPKHVTDRRSARPALQSVCVLLRIIALGSVAFVAGAQVPPTASLDARIASLLQQMTQQEKIEQLFYKTDGNARLGIPQFTGSDGPHGIGNKVVGWSCFPVTLAMAATWDPDLIQRVGHAIALEQASRARDRIAGPTLDLLNDPRNGRAPESIGEDPFLGGRITEGFLRGMSDTGVFGTIKHYNLNTYEANRETNNYLIDQRSLVEFWGAPWRRAVQDGGAQSVMCAYNLVNGEKCAENCNLIKTILRDTWGFCGYTMCDWGGFWSTEKAMASELDFCEGTDLYPKELPGLLKDGKITQSQLDRAVADVLRTKILSGMLDGRPKVPAAVRDCLEHRTLVYESALKSIVLLKNQGAILPLDAKIKSVAIIGPNAATLPLDGNSSSAVIPSYTIPLKQGLETLLGTNRVRYARGCDVNSTNRSGFAEAKRIAKESDVVIFAGGLDNTVEGEGYFIKGDRIGGTTDLPGVQNELINELAAANPNLVLVVISGGPCAVREVIKNVKGLIYAIYPGQEGGRALTDLLFGRENFSGKLPVTIPESDSQLRPRNTDFVGVVTNGIGYRWFDAQKLKPAFAFGFGLSYTTFKYENLRVTPDHSPAGQEITVQVDITNTGKRAGEEVTQLYLSTGDVSPAVPMPVKQLKGFKKVSLQPGEMKQVTFTLTSDDLYIFDAANGRYRVPTGKYTVRVGGASDELPLKAGFTLTPAEALPDLQVANIRTLPAFPKAGDKILFLASVFNRGTGPTPADKPISVTFRVNDQVVASSPDLRQSIPAGGMALVCGSEVAGSNSSWSDRAGTISVKAEADAHNDIKETIENNNLTTASITIRPRTDFSSAISPLLVGNNVWYKPGDAVWKASSGAGLRIIRIGGAAYDHRMPSNEQLTGWVNRIKAMGAEPMIQVSQYLPATNAAATVRFFNLTTSNRVAYWNIGNEPWLQRGRPRDRTALVQTVAEYVKTVASAMKEIDPTIKIFAPDACDYFDDMYDALLGGSSDITGKDANGRYFIDGISWHRYVKGDLATAGAKDFLTRIQKTRARLDYANELHVRTGTNALQWGIGEFNADGGSQTSSFADGQMIGQIYGYVMKYGGTYATLWSMFENGGSRSGSDFSFLNSDMTPRPSYYHMQLISQNFSGQYADGRCNVPTVRTYSAVDRDKIAVMLINVGEPQTANVRLNTDRVEGGCRINIDAGVPTTFEQAIGGRTTMVLIFNHQGQLTRRITYADGDTPKEEILKP